MPARNLFYNLITRFNWNFLSLLKCCLFKDHAFIKNYHCKSYAKFHCRGSGASHRVCQKEKGKKVRDKIGLPSVTTREEGTIRDGPFFLSLGGRGRVGNFPQKIPAKKNLLLKKIYIIHGEPWKKKLSKCFALSRFYCRPNKAMHSLKMRKKNLVPENRPAPPPYQKIMVHPLHERILQWLEPQYYIIFCVNNSFTVTIIWAGVNKSCFNCFCSTASCAEPVQILHHNCLWL